MADAVGRPQPVSRDVTTSSFADPRSAAFPSSRRQFLVSSAKAVAAAGLAPLFCPASALGRGGAVAPSERIRMGFIGLGGQGRGHVFGTAWTYVPGGYIARKDVQIVAMCDVRADRRDSARIAANQVYAGAAGKADYNGVESYNDFRELLARPDIDAVLVAVPYHWAAMISVMAMRAGKDVYCEKPVAITVREGQAVIEASKRYSRIYQAGMQQRSEYGGNFRKACDLVRNGRIGQLKEVYAYRQPGCFYPRPWTTDTRQPLPAGLDWELWLGPLPWRPFGGEAGHALTGMFVGDVNWSPHHYDIIQWTINPDPKAQIEVWTEPVKARGEWVVRYRYANGVIVKSEPYPGEPAGAEGGACFVGTEGRIVVDRSHLFSHPADIVQRPLRPTDSRVPHATGHSANFLECVRSRRLAVGEPEAAMYTMNAVLIGGIALALQRGLTWDPVKAEFPGDEQANRLLSYTPRPPWRL
jgi:hypothetical protein